MTNADETACPGNGSYGSDRQRKSQKKENAMQGKLSQNLGGKVAIITGAGSRGDGIGNGRAASVMLAEAGTSVVLVDIKEEWAQRTHEMIHEVGGTSIVIQADVTRQEDCRRIVEAAVQKFGRLDILVNNVGVTGSCGTVVDADVEAWNREFAINVTSVMLMSKYAVPEMVKVGKGAIINVSSVAGLRGGNPNIDYPTTKGAVVNMTRAMAAHHGKDGIRVNCVCPGMAHTPMVTSKNISDELREARRKRNVMQIEGSGWDIGAAILYLASDYARWVTGVILPVDGGTVCIAPRV